MSFTGTAVITQLSDSKVRITGLALNEHGSGTVGLFGATGSPPDVTLPAAFKTEHYTYDGQNVPFQDAINVTVNITGGGIGGGETVAVTKSGTSTGDFRLTFNDVGGDGPVFEVVIVFH